MSRKNEAGVLMGAVVVAAMLAGPVAQAATVYWGGGKSDIANGTPIPTGATAPYGVWDTTIKNWATDANGTSYAAWSSSGSDTAVLQNLVLNNQGVVAELTQTVDLAVGRIVAVITNTTGNCYNSGYRITATNSRTLTLAGDNPEISTTSGSAWNSADNTRYLEFGSNIKLAGSKGFTKVGYYGGKVVIRGDGSGLTGTVKSMDGGPVTSAQSIALDGSAANLRGVSLFDIRCGSFAIFNPASGLNNQIADSAVVRVSSREKYQGNRLEYGGFEYASKSGSIEELAQIKLDPFGYLVFKSGDATPGKLILNDPVAGIHRGQDGHGTALIVADSSRVLKTTVVVSNGIPTGGVIPWMALDTGEPLRLSPSNTLEVVPVTGAPADLSTWGGNANYSITNSTFTPSNYVTNGCRIDTLTCDGPSAGSAVVTIGTSASDLMTVGSGVIGYFAKGGNGLILTNGSITSGTNELNVFSGSGSANGAVTLYSRVVGNIALTLAGSKAIYLNSVNTHSNGTYLKNVVYLQTTACLPGPVFVEAGALCALPVLNAISTNASITIRRGGELNIPDGGEKSETFTGSLFIDGGMLTCGAGYGASGTFNSPAGILFGDGGSITQQSLNSSYNLRLYTDVACSAASSNQAFIATVNRNNMKQFLDLNTGATATRTFTVSNAVGLAESLPELQIDMPLRTDNGDTPYSVKLVKAGDGELALTELSGGFDGSCVVSNGTLTLSGYQPATNIVCNLTSYGTALTGLASTNGLRLGQRVGTNSVFTKPGYITSLDSSSQISMSRWTTSQNTNGVTCALLATGPLGASSVTVVGGKLQGSGGVGGSVTVKSGGTLAPGTSTNAASTFRIGGNLTVESGGILAIDLPAGTNDAVAVAGSVSISGGTLAVTGAKPAVGETLSILTSTNLTATFTSVTDGFSVKTSGTTLQLARRAAGFVFSAQ